MGRGGTVTEVDSKCKVMSSRTELLSQYCNRSNLVCTGCIDSVKLISSERHSKAVHAVCVSERAIGRAEETENGLCVCVCGRELKVSKHFCC